MKLVPCICWIKQGVPNATPKKIRLSKEELATLMGETHESSTHNDDSSSGDEDQAKPSGLRGSEKNGGDVESDEEEDFDQKYSLDDYDEDSDNSEKQGNSEKSKEKQNKSGMRGLACFPTPEQDPYITNQDVDSDEDPEEQEDFLLKPNDNQLVLGRIDKDQFLLEVYVYNSFSGDLYCHHEYMLEAPPLCLAAINYDPGNPDQGHKGNLCAVASMNPDIQIYDLDLVDSLEPVATLGAAVSKISVNKSGHQKTKKKKKVGYGHKDAVLCVGWNERIPHVLASGGADHSLLLWDLESAVSQTSLSGHLDKVQSLAWHPQEENMLLSGACDGCVFLWDCRSNSEEMRWVLDGEVEKLIWDFAQPFNFLSASSTGSVSYFDCRKKKPVSVEEKAHNNGISGLSLSRGLSACLASCDNSESAVKIWKLDSTALNLIDTIEMKMGGLHCVEFCPDSVSKLCVGGSKGDFVQVFDLHSSTKVLEAFQLPENPENDD